MMSRASADAVARLGTEGAFAVLARARALEAAGRDIIHLEIGEPDFETPRSRGRGRDRRDPRGRDALLPDGGAARAARGRRGVARRARAGSRSSRERVLVANGAKPFLFFTVLATCGPGDEVVYPDPGFPIYESAIRFAGATPVPLPLREERGFSFDPAELEQLLSRAHAARDPERAAEPDRRRDPARRSRAAAARRSCATPAWVLSDEVYSRITYDVEAPSIASLPGPARPHGPARRLLEDVLDDRLAARLRRRPRASSSIRSPG